MRLNRRTFTMEALMGLGALTGCTPMGRGSNAAAPRNFLLLMIDDLNDWATAVGDHPQVRTPNIDALGKSGTVFANAHAQAPICGPSRASLFSGLQPAQTGIYGQISDDQLGPAGAAVSPTRLLPQQLRAHGFYTAGRGKVSHQGGQEGMFDEYHPRLAKNGDYGPKPDKRFKWDSDKTHTDWGAYPDTDEEMIDHITASWGAGFLKREHTTPFMLALGFVRPHVPWYVPKKWLDMFPLEKSNCPKCSRPTLMTIPGRRQNLLLFLRCQRWNGRSAIMNGALSCRPISPQSRSWTIASAWSPGLWRKANMPMIR